MDGFADRYEAVAKQQADFLGFDLEADSDLTYTPIEGGNKNENS